MTALSFGLNRIRTLVSMATDNGGNLVTNLAPSFLIVFSLFLLETRTTIISRVGSKFGRILPWTYELAALERLKNPHRLIME